MTQPSGITRFRLKLMVSMAVLISGFTASGLFFAQRNLSSSVEAEQSRKFESNLSLLHTAQEVRHAVLLERCRNLSQRPRILAAFEDNALDLLYPSAREELRNLMTAEVGHSPKGSEQQALFYRFLDRDGKVIPPQEGSGVGWLSEDDEKALSLSKHIDRFQTGYRLRTAEGGTRNLIEIMITPIISTETDQSLGSLAIGFMPSRLERRENDENVQEIIWTSDAPGSNRLPEGLEKAFKDAQSAASAGADEVRFTWTLNDREFRIFAKLLNPGSVLPPAYEFVLYPLSEFRERQQWLSWQFLLAGLGLTLVGIVTSHLISGSLSQPVEKLAVDSEVNRKGRAEAETALSHTNEELERTSRFSSDASHQLKTPLTVMRAGLDELLARPDLPESIREELGNLTHQTFRLTSIVEDLLLLSRMDAGRLKLNLVDEDIIPVIEAGLDDLGVLALDLDLEIDARLPAALRVKTEKRYLAIILQNLLENARKYNQPGGRVQVSAVEADGRVSVRVGNTGSTIPPGMTEAIFERFHRGGKGENVPGHGLGLNLARQLARLHGGDLLLLTSADQWTEFEIRLQPAEPGN